MIRWPGSEQGRRFSGLVQSLDLFPTLLAAADLEVPDQDGEDLRGLFEDGGRGRRAVFAEQAGQGGWMVRTPEYKFMIQKKPLHMLIGWEHTLLNSMRAGQIKKVCSRQKLSAIPRWSVWLPCYMTLGN